MNPGDLVVWRSRHGASCTGKVLEVRVRPLAWAGQRLGSWTNNFYKEMALVEFNNRGKLDHQWMKASKLRTGVRAADGSVL